MASNFSNHQLHHLKLMMKAAVRRRPVLISSTVTLGGTFGYGYWKEYQANRQEQMYVLYQQQQQQQQLQQQNPSSRDDNNDNNTHNNHNKTTMKMMIPPPMLPRHYSWEDIHAYWSIRPISIVLRLFEITGQLTPLMVRYIWDFKVLHSNHSTSNTSTSTATTANADDYEQDQEDKEEKERNSIMRYHAQQWRQALTRLGPAFVKMGQQLSIRPDLVPPVVLEELQKLCDSVTPISDDIAMQLLETELNCHPSKLFTNLRFVASASLGQVYRGTLVISDNDDDDDDDGTQQRRRQKEEEVEVAVKIQRPGMMESFSLDLFLLQQWGVFMDAWTSVITHQKPIIKVCMMHGTGRDFASLKRSLFCIFFVFSKQVHTHVHLLFPIRSLPRTQNSCKTLPRAVMENSIMSWKPRINVTFNRK